MMYLLVRNRPTAGAYALARTLNGKVNRINSSRLLKTKNVYIVNWGCSQYPENLRLRENQIELNRPEEVKLWINKKYFLENSTARHPILFQSEKEGVEWMNSHTSRRLVARQLLSSHSGRGITILSQGQSIPKNTKLLLQYVSKKAEYRVHCFKNTNTVDVQKKRLRTGAIDPNRQIRNLEGGWVYCRENLNVPEDVIVQARSSFDATALDFGAVDVLWNEKLKEAFVLEINTAPGLEGRTVEIYAEQIRRMCDVIDTH